MNIIKILNYFYIYYETLHTTSRGITIMLYKKVNIELLTDNYIIFKNVDTFKPYPKIVIKKNSVSDGNNELEYLQMFKDNKNFVKLLGFYKTSHNVYIVTKFYKNGSLSHNLYKFTNEKLLSLYDKIKNILEYLDSINLNHGDIKESNILLNNKMEPIINDLESMHNKNNTSKITTKQYSIPININMNKDIWALNVMIYHIKFKKYPNISNIIKFNQIEILSQ